VFEIFKDYNIWTLSSPYVPELVCLKIYNENFMATNLGIYNHNMRRKLNLHVQYCSTVIFKKQAFYLAVGLIVILVAKIPLIV
jgi:hypothetical protein